VNLVCRELKRIIGEIGVDDRLKNVTTEQPTHIDTDRQTDRQTSRQTNTQTLTMNDTVYLSLSLSPFLSQGKNSLRLDVNPLTPNVATWVQP